MYVIEFPLPVREASNNRRGSWRGKSDPYARYKDDCLTLAGQAARNGEWPKPVAGKVLIDLDFYLCRTRARAEAAYLPLDWDNAVAAIKPIQDALVLAGLLPGDTLKYLRPGRLEYYTDAKEHQGRACVVVTLRPA